jgi:hypothetical protein
MDLAVSSRLEPPAEIERIDLVDLVDVAALAGVPERVALRALTTGAALLTFLFGAAAASMVPDTASATMNFSKFFIAPPSCGRIL